MKQSYKIYINDVTVILAQSKQVFNIPNKLGEVSIYTCNKEEELKKLIIALEIKSINTNLIILAKDLSWLQETFFSNFKIIRAGGGFVINQKKEVLMIFRNGKWDLPKGKMEKGEDIKTCAVREVTEETGAKIHQVLVKLGVTYHSYKLRDKWVLKQSNWFYMLAKNSSKLTPQTNEGIEDVRWVKFENTKKLLDKGTYNSIPDVFRMAKNYVKTMS